MYRHAVAVALVAVASVTGVTAFAAAPAAAQTNETVLGDVFSSDGPIDSITNLGRAALASRDRILFGIQQRLPAFLTDAIPALAPERQTAADELASVATFYNANNETLETYVNERADVTDNRTVKLTLHLRGETATRYLEVNATNGTIDRSEIVTSTNREITDTVDVCGYAAERSLEELKRFHDDFAEPNKDVSDEYLARLGGKYGGDVETTLLPTGGECGGGA